MTDAASDAVTGAVGDVVLAADRLLTPSRTLAPGWVHVRGGIVAGVGAGAPPSGPRRVDLPPGSTVVPGLVDIHVHGAGGGDMTRPDADHVRRSLRCLARHGVTACVASLVTAPADELEASLDVIGRLVRQPVPDGARLLGAHLEGPFLSPAHRGAHHAPSLREPDADLAQRLLDASPGAVRMLTLAPELPGADGVLALLADRGVVAAMGHTAATYDQTRAAVAAGVTVGTHLFNGMRSPHHREPGPALSLLDASEVVVELINDGAHVHPAAARVAARAAGEGRLALISDGVAATAAPDGEYRLGRVAIRSHEGRVETADGSSLGGGTRLLDGNLRRAVQVLGMSLADAVAAATTTPARALGVDHLVGSVEVGRRADLVVLDDDLGVAGVMVDGMWLDGL